MKIQTKLILPLIAGLAALTPFSVHATVIADWTFTGSGTISSGYVFDSSVPGGYTATLEGGDATLTSAGLVLDGDAYLSTNLPYSAFNSGPATMQSLVTLGAGAAGNYEAIFGSSTSNSSPFFGTDSGSTPGLLLLPFGLDQSISGDWTQQHNYSIDSTNDGYACIFQDGALGLFNSGGISSFTGDVLIGGQGPADAIASELTGTILRATISDTSARDGGDPGTAANGYLADGSSWTVGAGQAVPEPSTVAALLAGLGMLCRAGRRR